MGRTAECNRELRTRLRAFVERRFTREVLQRHQRAGIYQILWVDMTKNSK